MVWRYLGLLVAPYPQSLVHAVRVPDRPTDALSLMCAALLVLLFLTLFRRHERAPLLMLGGGWFFLFLVPSSSIIPLLELMSEHRVYLASIGWFLVLALFLVKVAPQPRRLTLPVIAAALLASYGALTWLRNQVWRDPLELWTQARDRAPNVWIASYALGDAYRLSGQCDLAVPEYLRAIDLVPAEPRAYISLAECFLRQGHPHAARRALRIALTYSPDAVQVYNNLGYLAYQRQDMGRARRLYEAALRFDPGNVSARRGLATIYEHVDDAPEAALQICRWLVRHDPSDVPSRACVRRLETRLKTEHAPLPAP